MSQAKYSKLCLWILLVWFLLHVDSNAVTSEFDPDFIIMKTSTDTAKGENEADMWIVFTTHNECTRKTYDLAIEQAQCWSKC